MRRFSRVKCLTYVEESTLPLLFRASHTFSENIHICAYFKNRGVSVGINAITSSCAFLSSPTFFPFATFPLVWLACEAFGERENFA